MNAALTQILQATSRSFYLTLRILPGGIRDPVGLAYLLARATDTIADTELVPLEQRLQALQLLRDRILGTSRQPLLLDKLAQNQSSPAERRLLEHCEAALAVLEQSIPADRQRIREVLQIITSGQELDLQRFAGASAAKIVALPTNHELDDYTYRVAGCVGEFWTHMCRAHLFPRAHLDGQKLLTHGVRFGKGLQLINILRDLPADLRQGRCYLPADELSAIGLAPADLLDATNEPRLRPVYDRYLRLAEDHLAAGWNYTNTLPRGCVRVRLACAWPILIGAATLKKLRAGNVLNPADRIKINRSEVKGLIARSIVLYPFSGAWKKQFNAETVS